MRDQHNVVTGLHCALPQHPEIEPGPVMGDEESRHARVIHSDAHSIARDPRLAYLEDRTSDPIAIADTHLVIGQTLHGEVFPELAVTGYPPEDLLLKPTFLKANLEALESLLSHTKGLVAVIVKLQVDRRDIDRHRAVEKDG